MRIGHVALVSLIMGAVAPLAAQDVYVGGANGDWHTLPAERDNGTVTFRLTPAETDGGRALVVIDKPEWMVLDDSDSPTVDELIVGESPLEATGSLEVVTAGAAPQVSITVSDAANPIAAESARLVLDGRAVAPASAEGEGKSLTLTFDLSTLGAGVYVGALEVADRAPSANVLTVPARVTIDGVLRHADGKTVTVCCGGDEFIVGGSGEWKRFIRLGDTGAGAYPTTKIGGTDLYPYEVTQIDDLDEGPGVRMRVRVTDVEGQDQSAYGEYEFDVEPAQGFAGLLVTSRARNLHADGDVYCFWGWLPGDGYVTPDGKSEWSMTYRAFGRPGWVYLPSTQTDGAGIGMISPLVFGESRFGTMLLYTDPTHVLTPKGEAVEMKMAFVLGESADDVAEAHDLLAASDWWPGG